MTGKGLSAIGALLCLVSLHGEDFISSFEYGQMLYQDPRGVSCVPCHGARGEGSLIGSYRDESGKVHRVAGPDIRNVDVQTIRRAVRKGPGLMPRYFLTEKEIEALALYLKQVNRDENGSEAGAR